MNNLTLINTQNIRNTNWNFILNQIFKKPGNNL